MNNYPLTLYYRKSTRHNWLMFGRARHAADYTRQLTAARRDAPAWLFAYLPSTDTPIECPCNAAGMIEATDTPPAHPADFSALVDTGIIEVCRHCGEYSTYDYQYNTMNTDGTRILPGDGFADGGELYTDEEIHPTWPDVYLSYQSSRLGGHSCGNCNQFLD